MHTPSSIGWFGADRSGFTLVETLMVVVVVGLAAGIALPRIGMSRYQANAAARVVVTTLSYAQRTAISRQANMLVGFDVARRGMRVHEDRDNDNIMDAGERVTFTALPDGITFGIGGTPPRPFGAAPVTVIRVLDGLPTLIYRRDGSASEAAGAYLTTIAGLAVDRRTDVRAIEISRATGRAAWFTYATSTWKRGD